MAHRKSHRRHRRHHRRMGAVGGLDLKTPAFAALGAVGATYLINGPMKTSSFVAPLAIAAGIFLPKFVKGDTMKAVGVGLAAGGVISLAQNAGVISGIGRVMIHRQPGRMGRVMIHGPGGPISAVAGIPPLTAARQTNAENIRRAAAGRTRVITGAGSPISAIAGFDDGDL